MKQVRILLCLLIAVVSTSCLKETVGQYSPSIICNMIQNTNGDTLNLTLDSKQDFYRLDTLHIGDTAQFIFTFWAYDNNLLTTEVIIDTTYANLQMLISDEIRNAMTASSDTANGIINFNPGYSGVQIPLNYIAKKEGTPSMFVGVYSDSKYSPTQFEIRTPIIK